MRHEIMIPFEIHTEAIEQRLEKDAFDYIISELISELKENAPKKWVGYNKQISYEAIINDAAHDFLNEHKNELLELAARHVANCMQRTKAFKEKVGDLID